MELSEIKKAINREPYYETDLGVIYCGDCLDIMPLIPDKSIDMILSDPPYGIDFCSSMTNRKERLQNDKFDDWIEILPDMLKQFERIITPIGCCCCCCGGGKTPVTALFTVEAIKYFNLIQTLVWEKFIGLGWRYRPAYENIIILSKDKDNYNFFDTSKKCSNVIKGINQDIPNNEEHPTQKPPYLMERLIKIHSQENQIIIDPFFGSGTTGAAAERLNRYWLGIEISAKYCEIAVKRIKKEYDQLKMF
jgi:site-specific DNA-methyltransferase (adenine-specific)